MPGHDAAGRAVRRLGPYELLRELGRGGFAEVWLARRTGPGGFESRVAIKTVKIELRTDPVFQKMFMDEAKLAARINHPNVVSIFELGEVDDVLYLVMEYVTGRPLDALNHMMTRAGTPIPVGIVMRILADTCAGLHAAHELERDGKSLGVIHRDVSPQNILVSDKGTVKLIDFGVAKANDRLAAETTDGHTKGKLRYMAPEQAMAKPVDRRADIWAVGAVAYDLIEGHPPHDGHNDLARLFKLMDTSPPPAFATDVPVPIADVIRKSLERDPTLRWQTAAEMRAAIEAALDACNLRVTADTVTAFFGAALAASSKEEDDEARSDGAILRDRLQRPSLREAMATIDVPSPDAHASANANANADANAEPAVETLSALDTSPHGVPTRSSRARVAALGAAFALGAGGLFFGLRHDAPAQSSSEQPTAPAPSGDMRAIPDPTAPTASAPTTANPSVIDEGVVPADTAVAAPSFVALPQASTVTSDRKKPSVPARPPRVHPAKPPPPGAAPSSRPRYDDTIQ